MHEQNDNRFDDQHSYDPDNAAYTSDEPNNPYLPDEQPASQDTEVETTPITPAQTQYSGSAAPAVTVASPSQPDTTPSDEYLPAPQTPLATPQPAFSRKRHAFVWFAIGAISMLIFGSLVSFASYGVYSYVNRSTPMKTLDGFCDALLHDKFDVAFDHLSRRFQNTVAEQDFATVFQQAHVVDCSHGVLTEDDKPSLSTEIKFVIRPNGTSQTSTSTVVLVKDTNNTWKINDLTAAS